MYYPKRFLGRAITRLGIHTRVIVEEVPTRNNENAPANLDNQLRKSVEANHSRLEPKVKKPGNSK
jgi:hypothetical protein